MGSYCSIHNDSKDETVMVYLGANPHVIKPILWTLSGFATMLSGAAAWGIINATIVEYSVAEYTLVVTASAIASATGSLVSATNYALESLQNKVVADFAKGGYSKLLPGQTHIIKKPLAFNMRAWVIRIERQDSSIVVKRANASVWTSPRRSHIRQYNVCDKQIFKKWRSEIIPIEMNITCDDAVHAVHDDDDDDDDIADNKEGFSVVRSGREIQFVEDTEESGWICVDEV